MDGGAVLGSDSLGMFILGTSGGEAVPPTPRLFTISAAISGDVIAASISGATASAVVSGSTISASVTVNEEG